MTEQNHENRGLRLHAARPEYEAGLPTAVPPVAVLHVQVCVLLRYATLRYVV